MPANMTPPIRHAEPHLNEKLEKLFLASISAGPDENGHYREVTYNTGSKDYEEAQAWVQRLHRPRYWRRYKRKNTNGSWVSKYGLIAEIIKADDGNYAVRYHATTWQAAKIYMMNKPKTEWAY